MGDTYDDFRLDIHGYREAVELGKKDRPFYGLVAAAMRRADTGNLARLRAAFPGLWEDWQARYWSPGGLLPTDPPRAFEIEAEKSGTTAEALRQMVEDGARVYDSEDAEGEGDDDEGEDLEECCIRAEETGESHYHCANCGEVSGLMGHYDFAAEAFTCTPKGATP